MTTVPADVQPPAAASDGSETGAAGAPELRVIIVDDHELIREGLRRAFERAGDFRVVGEAASVSQALALLPTQRPDVVVTDVRLPDGNGIALAAAIRAQSASVGIVVLTMYAADEHLFGALDAGASGFINKDAPADDVVSYARQAAANPGAFIAEGLSEAMKRRMAPSTGPSLSARETEVLGLLVEGLSAGQMARRLFISESTVKTHISKMYDKLGATNRAQAVMAAVRQGLVANSLPGDRPTGH